jgi:sodium-coupled neutral amino acid transporter 11
MMQNPMEPGVESALPMVSSPYAVLEYDDGGSDGDEGDDVAYDEQEGAYGPFAPGTSTVAQGTFNMTNTVVGAGIIGLPYALKQAGFWVGIGALLAMAYMTELSLRLLMRVAFRARCNTYEALATHAFGASGFWLVSSARFLFSGGAMLAFLMILADTVTSVVSAYTADADTDALRRYVVLGSSFGAILPIVLLRDVTSLSRFSLLSISTVAVMELVVLAQLGKSAGYYAASCTAEEQGSCAHVFPAGGEPPAATVFEGGGFAPALAIFAFAFTCHDSSFIILSSLREPTYKNWCRITRRALLVAVVLCLVMAVPGYLVFRDKTDPNLLNNYPASDGVMNAVRCLYAFTMVLTFPMCFNVCRGVLNTVCFGMDGESSLEMPLSRHLGLTLPLFLATVGLAVLVKSLGVVLELTGAFGATMVAFVLPAAATLKIRRDAEEAVAPLTGASGGRRRAAQEPQRLPILLLSFGVVMGLTATVQSINGAINNS